MSETKMITNANAATSFPDGNAIVTVDSQGTICTVDSSVVNKGTEVWASDFNIFVNAGLYIIQSNDMKNAPQSRTARSVLQVLNSDNNAIQILFMSINEGIYYRTRFNGNWYGWRKIVFE